MNPLKKQLLVIILFVFLCSTKTNAQVPDWEWARSATFPDTSGSGEGNSIATDAFGNFYITGQFMDTAISFGSFTLNSPAPDHFNVYLTKYDSSGNVLWAKNAGGLAHGNATSVTTDAAGNAYITGDYDFGKISFDNDTLNNAFLQSIFLAKYNSSGNVAWAKAILDSSGCLSYWITSDPFGNVFICGMFFEPAITFGSNVLTSSGGADLFIAKYDSSGNNLWAKGAIGASAEVAYSVTSDALGNAYVTGYFHSPALIFGTDTLHRAGGNLYFDMFIAKYDSSGNVLWGRGAGGNGDEVGQSVASYSSGGVYATGFFNSQSITFGSFTLIKNNYNNFFLVKYDASGNVIWAKSFNGGFPYTIVSDSLDNIYMTGAMFTSISFDTLTLQITPGPDPMFIAKFDSSGHALWAKALKSGGYYQNSVALGTNGSIYIVSDFHTFNPFIIGNNTLIPTGLSDIFVAKLGDGSATGITPAFPSYGNISVYPNPVSNEFTVSGLQFPAEIRMFNVLGKEILSQRITTIDHKLKTANFSPGIYFYEVRNNKGVIGKGKVVKD